MRILLITLTLMFTLVAVGASPALADKVVIVNNGCDHDDYHRHSEHKHWKKHRKHREHEHREVRRHHHYETHRHRPAGGHFVAVGGPTFGFWMTGR